MPSHPATILMLFLPPNNPGTVPRVVERTRFLSQQWWQQWACVLAYSSPRNYLDDGVRDQSLILVSSAALVRLMLGDSVHQRWTTFFLVSSCVLCTIIYRAWFRISYATLDDPNEMIIMLVTALHHYTAINNKISTVSSTFQSSIKQFLAQNALMIHCKRDSHA
jgi:hypothetical protein